MSVKIKIIVYLLVILIIGAMGAVLKKEPHLHVTNVTNKSPKTVIVDAGHGGLTNTTDWV